MRRSVARDDARALPRARRRPPREAAGPARGEARRTSTLTVDQAQRADAHLDARVLHDVLVSAGARLDGQAVEVTLGRPRLVSTNTTTSSDGTSIDREDHIEVTLSITTREHLELFLDAIAHATVDHATLLLTPRPTEPAVVRTTTAETRP